MTATAIATSGGSDNSTPSERDGEVPPLLGIGAVVEQQAQPQASMTWMNG